MAQTKVNKSVAKVLTGLHAAVLKLSGGRIGAKMTGAEVILLGTTGRKSGKHREQPLVGGPHPGGWIVIASYSGHDTHPAWYHNLTANPSASVTSGGEKHQVTAREVHGEERSTLWNEMLALNSDYGEYQAVTDREIPVLVLERQ